MSSYIVVKTIEAKFVTASYLHTESSHQNLTDCWFLDVQVTVLSPVHKGVLGNLASGVLKNLMATGQNEFIMNSLQKKKVFITSFFTNFSREYFKCFSDF